MMRVGRRSKTVEAVDMWTAAEGGVVKRALAAEDNRKRETRLERFQPLFSGLVIKV